MYILFPIGIMYYFGTNLDGKFSVPDFWPKPEQTNKIPFERDEMLEEIERLKYKRLNNRNRRLQEEGRGHELSRQAMSLQSDTRANGVTSVLDAKTREGDWASLFGRR